MFLSRLSLRRPVLATVVVGLFVVFGLAALPRMPVELLPAVDIPYLLVRVVYPGAGPEDVLHGVVEPLEDSLGRVDGLKTLRTTAVPDAGIAILEFEMGTDVRRATEQVRARLDELDQELPEGARRPTVEPIDLNAAPVLQLAVTGTEPLEDLSRWVHDELEQPLARVPGVSHVELVGERERELRVELDESRLLANHLTLKHVVEAVRSGGVEVPGGILSDGRTAAPLRLAAAYTSVDELRAVQVVPPVGKPLRLDELGRVYLGTAPVKTLARVQGRPAIGVSVYKRPDVNTVALGRSLRERLDEIRARAPPGVEFELVHDASVSIRDSIQNLVETLGLCILLTAGLLYLFLHDWRGTAIVALSIPASLVGSLTFVNLAGFTINYMTLMGLAITVGTLVDASIVVLESIAREVEEGERDSVAAADRGTGRVFLGVLGSSVTNIVVFTPIAFMKGIVGRFFVQFALTVTFSMLLSLLVSFTLTPMLAAWLYRRGRSAGVGPLARAWERGFAAFVRGYRGVLRWALAHRAATLGGLGLVFVAALALLGPRVSLGWFRNPDQGFFILRVVMPEGTDLETTGRAVERAERVLLADPRVERVYAELGRYHTLFGPLDARNRGELHVVLVPRDQRPPTSEVMDELRPALARAVPGAALLLNELGGAETAVRDDFMVEIFGDDDEALAEVSRRVVEAFESLPNVVGIHAWNDERAPQLQLVPDRRALAEAGLTPVQLGLLLRVAVEGDTSAHARIGDEQLDVRVRLQERDRESLPALEALTVQVASGAQLPLRALGELRRALLPASISRQGREKRVTVTANLAYGATGDTAAALRELVEAEPLPPGVRLRIGGEEEQRAEAAGELGRALALAVVLTVLLLAGLLESFVHPFTILSTLPLALVGVLVALVSTGVVLDIFGLMALVMLVGIVVNNAILLIEGTENLRAEGLGLEDALEGGAVRRMRPIFMTSLSTVAGMLPLALALGPGAELRQAMALVSIGGVAVSSVLILLACPVIYHAVEDFRARRRERAARQRAAGRV